MKVYLKVKVKSLAEEAKIIRREERKYPGESRERFGLHYHRVVDVRREARSALLAYGFLRGRRYLQLERTAKSSPDWRNVQRLVEKFGEGDKRDIRQRFEEWVQGGDA